ncbi:hypothetical protein Fmac_020904 [Flemingia macrophylla]|uniref:Uncharacterized protein n=1 Tax=Flemingia macrophylla TaxID=520843 RepID=A0ABD1LVA1_9FABA
MGLLGMLLILLPRVFLLQVLIFHDGCCVACLKLLPFVCCSPQDKINVLQKKLERFLHLSEDVTKSEKSIEFFDVVETCCYECEDKVGLSQLLVNSRSKGWRRSSTGRDASLTHNCPGRLKHSGEGDVPAKGTPKLKRPCAIALSLGCRPALAIDFVASGADRQTSRVFLRMSYLELQTSELDVLGVPGKIRKRSTISLLEEKPSSDVNDSELNGSSGYALENDEHDVDSLNVDSSTLDSSLCIDSSCIDTSYVDFSTVDIDTSLVDSFAIDSHCINTSCVDTSCSDTFIVDTSIIDIDADACISHSIDDECIIHNTDDDSYIATALDYTGGGDCDSIDIIFGLALEFGITPDFSLAGHSFTCDTSALCAICIEINNAITGTIEVAISNDPLVGDALVDTTLIDHAILEDALPIFVSVPECALTYVKPPSVQEDISFTCVYNSVALYGSYGAFYAYIRDVANFKNGGGTSQVFLRRPYLELHTSNLDVLGVPGKIRKRSTISLLEEKPSSDVKGV